MSKLLLEAVHIQKNYADRLVLDVDRLCIYDGERIALIGENGAGKSTLLSILAGETEPDSGHVRRGAPLAFIRQSGETRTDGSARVRSQFRAPEQSPGPPGPVSENIPYAGCGTAAVCRSPSLVFPVFSCIIVFSEIVLNSSLPVAVTRTVNG